MGLSIDQPPGPRNRHMVWSVLVQSNGEKLPERERIRQTPRDATLAIESFEEPDHHDAKVQSRRQGRTSQFGVVKARATLLAVAGKAGLVQSFIQTVVKRMPGRRGQLSSVPQRLLPPPALFPVHCPRANFK